MRHETRTVNEHEKLSHLAARFNRLHEEKQAEILGMAEALTFVQHKHGTEDTKFLAELLSRFQNRLF
jgi:hypothetical protein